MNRTEIISAFRSNISELTYRDYQMSQILVDMTVDRLMRLTDFSDMPCDHERCIHVYWAEIVDVCVMVMSPDIEFHKDIMKLMKSTNEDLMATYVVKGAEDFLANL